MPRYFIWTTGCQMNKAESERIASGLRAAGYEEGESLSDSDLLVLNTCVVRQSAEDKALGTLSLLKGIKKRRPSLQILVTGCFVDSDTDSLRTRFPHVDAFFRPGGYAELVGFVENGCIGSSVRVPVGPSGSVCVLVPIIEGCDNFCSYCIVPYRRGRERSRPFGEVVEEVGGLAVAGAREVILLGQNVDSYGHDLPGGPTLADLLAELEKVDGLVRIRFLANHPKDMSGELIDAVASLSKVCEHLELAVQSGDDEVLKRMRRGYDVDQYRQLVRRIRLRVPHISLSTDVIVGFPGETKRQFENTYSLLSETRFDVVHVAAYSPRQGTVAAREYEDDVPALEKRDRFRRIDDLQAGIAGQKNSELRGGVEEVLVEGRKNGRWFGRTRSNKLVFFDANDYRLGQLVDVRIGKTSPWALQGEILDHADAGVGG